MTVAQIRTEYLARIKTEATTDALYQSFTSTMKKYHNAWTYRQIHHEWLCLMDQAFNR